MCDSKEKVGIFLLSAELKVFSISKTIFRQGQFWLFAAVVSGQNINVFTVETFAEHLVSYALHFTITPLLRDDFALCLFLIVQF